MSQYEYRLVAGGWFLLLLLLTVFWFRTLRRLAEVLKERMKSTGSHETIPEGTPGLFLYLFRGEFKRTGDERLIGVCQRLRQLLYGYVGGIGVYIIFLVLYRPRY
jgi:hypothetical protein